MAAKFTMTRQEADFAAAKLVEAAMSNNTTHDKLIKLASLLQCADVLEIVSESEE